MAISTQDTYLMYKATSSASSYSKLIDIVDFSDIEAPVELLDTTTLSDGAYTHIKGLKPNDAITCTANYTATDYGTISALTGTYPIAIWFGATSTTPDGSNGKFEFEGQISVSKTGGGVNEVQRMTITLVPTTEVTFSAS